MRATYSKTAPNVYHTQNKVCFFCLLYNLPLKRVPVFDVFLLPLDTSYTYFSLETNRQGSLHSNQVIYMALLLVIITTKGKGCIPEDEQRTIAEINWPLRPKRQIVTKIEELKGWLACLLNKGETIHPCSSEGAAVSAFLAYLIGRWWSPPGSSHGTH